MGRYRGLSVHRQRDLGSVSFKSKKTRFRPWVVKSYDVGVSYWLMPESSKLDKRRVKSDADTSITHCWSDGLDIDMRERNECPNDFGKGVNSYVPMHCMKSSGGISLKLVCNRSKTPRSGCSTMKIWRLEQCCMIEKTQFRNCPW